MAGGGTNYLSDVSSNSDFLCQKKSLSKKSTEKITNVVIFFVK